MARKPTVPVLLPSSNEDAGENESHSWPAAGARTRASSWMTPDKIEAVVNASRHAFFSSLGGKSGVGSVAHRPEL